ncbi:MAG TPA: hypothetical protein VMA77_25990, partial [Solirubrobacteraceae bacterium]|nr:hypothetical protein [Solirubrobacteraceae bacterium]
MCRSVRGPALILALAVLLAAGAIAVRPAPARAGLLGTLGSAGCKLIGTVGEGWWGDVCNGADKAVGVLGNLGGKAGKVAGVVSKVAGNPLVQRAAALAAIVAFVLGGAKWTMSHLATAIAQTTSPALTAAWFTTVYLKVEAVAWLLTIPFLVAAAVQAVFRAEPGMLARVVFIYLPLAAVGCALAVPITVLLLAGTDSLSGGLVHLAGQDGISFLSGTGAWVTAGLALIDPFVAVIAAMVIAVCGLALWTELIVRELAVYVVVAMLPLVFCAIVWPARRMWAIRTVEVLIALILSKLAIIVPLALGAAALSHDQSGGGAGRVLAGLALVGIGCLAPWLL